MVASSLYRHLYLSLRRPAVVCLMLAGLACGQAHAAADADADVRADADVVDKAAMMEKAAMMDKDTAVMHKPAAPGKPPGKPMMAGTDIHNSRACDPNGIALSGVDVVSYHKPSGPLIGSAEFAVTHGDLTYHFMSAAHATEFSADPDRYLPKYLGWCATSLAVGALTCPNPLNYKIENGELLLFETTGFTNGQNLWNADPLDYRRRADKNQDAFLEMSGLEMSGLEMSDLNKSDG